MEYFDDLSKLKDFISSSAFSLLSKSSQQEMLDKVNNLEHRIKEETFRKMSSAIVSAVEPYLYPELNAKLVVTINNGNVDVTGDDIRASQPTTRKVLENNIKPATTTPLTREPVLAPLRRIKPENIAMEYPHYLSIIFNKAVDWSILNYGFVIPHNYQRAAENAFGRELEAGENATITIIYNHQKYQANFTRVKSGDLLRIMWVKTSGITTALQECYSHQYNFLQQTRDSILSNKPRTKLPDSLKRELYLCSTTIEGEFILIDTMK